MKELQVKVCLITGATRGNGRATALAMADAGADVIFNYAHSTEQAREVEGLLRDKGVRAQGYQANVASPEEVEAMVAQSVADFGPISILVNNAGITRDRSFLKMTRQMWDDVMGVNLDGLFHVTHAVIAWYARKWVGENRQRILHRGGRQAISGKPTTRPPRALLFPSPWHWPAK